MNRHIFENKIMNSDTYDEFLYLPSPLPLSFTSSSTYLLALTTSSLSTCSLSAIVHNVSKRSSWKILSAPLSSPVATLTQPLLPSLYGRPHLVIQCLCGLLRMGVHASLYCMYASLSVWWPFRPAVRHQSGLGAASR